MPIDDFYDYDTIQKTVAAEEGDVVSDELISTPGFLLSVRRRRGVSSRPRLCCRHL